MYIKSLFVNRHWHASCIVDLYTINQISLSSVVSAHHLSMDDSYDCLAGIDILSDGSNTIKEIWILETKKYNTGDGHAVICVYASVCKCAQMRVQFSFSFIKDCAHACFHIDIYSA